MNPPPDHSDSLLKILVDEAANLPVAAAREAQRASLHRLRHRRQITIALATVTVAICAWQTLPSRHSDRQEIAPPQEQSIVALLSTPQEPAQYIKVQTEQEALSDPAPIPTGLSKEQRDLLEASRGLPLLLVKDASGKVTRIHVIER